MTSLTDRPTASSSLNVSPSPSADSSRSPTPLSTISTTAIFHGHAGHPTLGVPGQKAPVKTVPGNPNRALEATRLRLGGFDPKAGAAQQSQQAQVVLNGEGLDGGKTVAGTQNGEQTTDEGRRDEGEMNEVNDALKEYERKE